MKTYCFTLLYLALAVTFTRAQTPLVGAGSSYTNIFTPNTTLTHNVPGGGLLSITVDNTTSTTSAGLWDLAAQGGANANIVLSLIESSAQTQLVNSTLKFNINNPNNSLFGLLGVGASVHYGWEATAYFDTPGSVLNYGNNTSYHISFDVDGDNGLLDSIAGVNSSLSFELVDSLGNALASNSNGSLISVAGLLGGLQSGTINLDYTVQGTVPSGPIGIRFRGDTNVGTTALNLGTDFATISNVNISATPIPEPAGLMMIAAVGAMTVLIRRRRALAV